MVEVEVPSHIISNSNNYVMFLPIVCIVSATSIRGVLSGECNALIWSYSLVYEMVLVIVFDDESMLLNQVVCEFWLKGTALA